MNFYYVNNSKNPWMIVEEDQSPEEQMKRIDQFISMRIESCKSQQEYDYLHPIKFAKAGFIHRLRMVNAWNFLNIDDEHKQILLDKLWAMKIGNKKIIKVEHAKPGEKHDISIYWK